MISLELFQALMNGKSVQYQPRASDQWVDVHSGCHVAIEAFKELRWRLKPPEQRNWSGALEWLKEGKNVGRAEWQGGYWLVLGSGSNLQWQDKTCGRPAIYVGYYRFMADDFEATDWEIVGCPTRFKAVSTACPWPNTMGLP